MVAFQVPEIILLDIYRDFRFSTLPLRKIIRQRPYRYKLKSPWPLLGLYRPVGVG